MKLQTIDKLCCPFDKADLTLQIIAQDLEKNIQEGLLSCKECNRYYPIIKGIPIMSPDEYREFNLEQSSIDKWKHQQVNLQGKKFENFRLSSSIAEHKEI